MLEETIRHVLRISAVLTMLVGAILLTHSVIGHVTVSMALREIEEISAAQSRSLGFASGGQYIGSMAVVAWGGVLWAVSPALARAVRA